MPVRMASEARRFTWLVDVFYDRRVKLIMSAEVPPEALYTEGPAGARVSAHGLATQRDAVGRIPGARTPRRRYPPDMKNTVFAILLGLAALPLWAQTAATTANADLDAERARLSDERKAVEARYATEQAACYKKFAVEGCLEDSRHRRRADTDDIKRQEAAINDFERKRRGAAELDKLEQQKSTQQSQDAEREARAIAGVAERPRATCGRTRSEPRPDDLGGGGAEAPVREQAARSRRRPGQGGQSKGPGPDRTGGIRSEVEEGRGASRRSGAAECGEDQAEISAFAGSRRDFTGPCGSGESLSWCAPPAQSEGIGSSFSTTMEMLSPAPRARRRASATSNSTAARGG